MLFKTSMKSMDDYKRQQILQSTSYKMLERIAIYMDTYHLDPIIGLIPGIGDLISAILAIPFIYYSLFTLKSIPLTLAIINNILLDICLGLIPMWIGDFIDIFNLSFKRNIQLILGYINDDPIIIRRIRKKVIMLFITMIILGILIIFMLRLTVVFIQWIIKFL